MKAVGCLVKVGAHHLVAIGYLADLQPKTFDNAGDAELDVGELMLQLLANHQQGTHLLGSVTWQLPPITELPDHLALGKRGCVRERSNCARLSEPASLVERDGGVISGGNPKGEASRSACPCPS